MGAGGQACRAEGRNVRGHEGLGAMRRLAAGQTCRLAQRSKLQRGRRDDARPHTEGVGITGTWSRDREGYQPGARA